MHSMGVPFGLGLGVVTLGTTDEMVEEDLIYLVQPGEIIQPVITSGGTHVMGRSRSPARTRPSEGVHMTDPAVLSVLPGRLDIEFLTGNPVVVELTWLDADGDPVDVSGAATGQVLTLAGVAVVDGELDVDTTDGANGVMVVTLSAELSAELSTSHRFIIETDRCVLNGLLAPYPPGSGPPVGPVSASVVVTTEPATVTVTAAVSSTGGGGSGDVVGPASSSTGRAAEFADATGKLLREAPLTGAGGRPVLDGDGTWADSLIPPRSPATQR